MSIPYNPSTDFSAKDDMVSTNPAKILSGVPFDVEFGAISAAFQLAAPALSPTFTGNATFNNVAINGTTDVGALSADTIAVTTVNGTTPSTWDATTATVNAGAAGWDTTKTTVDSNSSNWNTAYGWGNHADAGYLTSFTDTTYAAGTNLNLSGNTFNLDTSIGGLDDVDTAVLSIGGWQVKLEGNNLVFAYGGSDKLKIDTSGNITASGDVTAFGSP